MLTPLPVGSLLNLLGVAGPIAFVVTTAIALYRGRSLLVLLGSIGTHLRVAGVLAFLGVLAAAGLVPGVELSVDRSTLASAAPDVARVVWGSVPVQEVLPGPGRGLR